MKIERRIIGYDCVLSPKEVDYSKREGVLQLYIEEWNQELDGTYTLKVRPWRLNSRFVMEVFKVGLSSDFLIERAYYNKNNS